jgi:putative redox protein
MDLISVKAQPAGEVTVQVRGHRWVCDHGRPDGGADAGPSPAELLVAAYGACVGLLVGAYCRRLGYADGAVRVSLTHEMAGDPRRIAAIVADLEVPRDLPAEKHAAVRRLAEACPLHATLRQAIRIDLEIIAAGASSP